MSGPIKDGGPAFPTTAPLESWGDPNKGMSLRDWFAGQVLAGYLANPRAIIQSIPAKETARACYQMADAMLAAREAAS